MPGVEVLSPPALPLFRREGLQPPSDLYVDRDDAIFLTSYNSATSITIHARGTILRPDGRVVPFQVEQSPATDRTATTTVQELGEGFLLSCSVFLGSGSAKRGQCYMQLGIARGLGAARFPHRILTQGYIGTAVNLTWPGNRLEQPTEGVGFNRAIVGTNPAANVEILETVPTGARWKFYALRAVLATDANVANRRPSVVIDDGTNIFAVTYHPLTAPASSSVSFDWAQGMRIATTVRSSDDITGLPIALTISGGYRIRTATENLQAGDDWAAPTYMVEEWIEP